MCVCVCVCVHAMHLPTFKYFTFHEKFFYLAQIGSGSVQVYGLVLYVCVCYAGTCISIWWNFYIANSFAFRGKIQSYYESNFHLILKYCTPKNKIMYMINQPVVGDRPEKLFLCPEQRGERDYNCIVVITLFIYRSFNSV